MEEKEENPKELIKQIKYLKQKVAYYEALAEECGLKINEVSKKTIQCNQTSSRTKRRKTNSLLQNCKHQS